MATSTEKFEEEIYLLYENVCKGLADPKRLLIINELRSGEMSVGELCEALGLPQANVSQHLAILRDKALVHARKDGQRVYYTLASEKLPEAIDLLRSILSEIFYLPST